MFLRKEGYQLQAWKGSTAERNKNDPKAHSNGTGKGNILKRVQKMKTDHIQRFKITTAKDLPTAIVEDIGVMFSKFLAENNLQFRILYPGRLNNSSSVAFYLPRVVKTQENPLCQELFCLFILALLVLKPVCKVVISDTKLRSILIMCFLFNNIVWNFSTLIELIAVIFLVCICHILLKKIFSSKTGICKAK